MYKVISTDNGKVIASCVPVQSEANRVAHDHAVKVLSKDPNGKRVLGWYKDKRLPAETVCAYSIVIEMIGDWIEMTAPENAPETTTEEETIVFTTKGGQRYLGSFDAEEGFFVASDQMFPPEKVTHYMILPDDDE